MGCRAVSVKDDDGVDHCHCGCGVLVYCSMEGGDPSIPHEFQHHLKHLILINAVIVPLNAIARGEQVTTDLPLCHATNELSPRVLTFCILDTCPSGVVQKLVILHPQGSVPGFVVCPTVVGGSGHVVRLLCCFNYTAQSVPDYPADDTCSSVTYIHFIHASVPSFHMVQSSFHCLA